MKCVAYVRVSTKEQDEEVQKKAILEFSKSRGLEVIRWYVDKGESGSKSFKERPSGNQLLNELEVLKPECVLSWSIDRLGRTMLDTMNIILELEKRGLKVITVKEEFLQSLDENIRKLILSFLSWVAEYERRRIRERQEEAWSQGKLKGRPPKVTDEQILYYLRKYPTLSIKDIHKIMSKDGIDIAYDTLVKRIKKLKQEGKIKVKLELKT